MADKIEHSHLDIRGLSIHLAHTGKGELGTVVFLHGFPEIWYSWKHQMIAVAAAGFKAIAPDLRGYGLSGQPPEPENTTWEDLLADLLAVLDSFSIPKVFIVGKDFGAIPAYNFALQHPDRVLGVVTLGVPSFFGWKPSVDLLPEGFYVLRWQEPGRAEADFGRFDAKRVVRTIYILFSRSEIPIAKEGQEILELADLSTPLPQWFTEEDLNAYAALYEIPAFDFPCTCHIGDYQSLAQAFTACSPHSELCRVLTKPILIAYDRSLNSAGPAVADPKVEAPALLIMGEEDYVFKFPGMKDYIRSGTMKRFVPHLEIVYIPEGSHFVQEQFPDQVNQLIITFLKNHI